MNMFHPRRVLLAMLLAPFGDPVFAQESARSGYNSAKPARELHFTVPGPHGFRVNIPELPYLVELARDATELRCARGKPLEFIQASEPLEKMYYCPGKSAPFVLGGEVIRFDRAPSPSPRLKLKTGGMGVTLDCDLGTLHDLYQPAGKTHHLRFACA